LGIPSLKSGQGWPLKTDHADGMRFILKAGRKIIDLILKTIFYGILFGKITGFQTRDSNAAANYPNLI
jgi:hypothetical protein